MQVIDHVMQVIDNVMQVIDHVMQVIDHVMQVIDHVMQGHWSCGLAYHSTSHTLPSDRTLRLLSLTGQSGVPHRRSQLHLLTAT